MAEFVELKLEEMLPELEQMQRVELFTEEEIRAIIKKRRDFEYKMQKHTKYKEDYLKYIQYEINLLTLLRLRREKIGYQFKKPEIDYAIANRIHKLFMYALGRFPSDLKIWMSHLEFCKRMKWNSSVSRLFVRLLAVKSNEPALWILAAKWEFEENGSASNGRGLLLRALRFHPGNIKIYTEAFRLELLEADRLRKRREVLGLSCEAELPEGEEERSKILDGQLAVLFYGDVKKNAKGATDLLPFLVVAREFDFTQKIQEDIISDMRLEHGDDEITWDTVARGMLDKSSVKLGDGPTKLKDRIEMCCSTYEDAVKRIDSAKMWQLYVDTLFTLNENDLVRSKIRHKLNDVCQRALTKERLTDQHVINWTNILENETFAGISLKSILEDATRQFPKCAALWSKYLTVTLGGTDDDALFQIDTGTGDDGEPMEEAAGASNAPVEVPDVFWKAVKALGDESETIPVWQTVISHFESLAKTNPNAAVVVEELFAKAIAAEPPIGPHFKPLFLSWISNTKGLDEARKYYESQASAPPLVKQFHYVMMEMELARDEPDLNRVRKSMENAVTHFGTSDCELWLHYVRFETERGDASRVGTIHQRAKGTLAPALADQFLTQFTLVQLDPGRLQM